jgi:formamidopyrimidine-DNA glycosylase
VLLDQRVAAGLGNIYAAEALWRARLSPLRPANMLTAADRSRLVRAIRGVLVRARRHRERYYGASPDGGAREGRFDVYDREGQPCRRCGAPIARITQAGRSTYLCPVCQAE